MLPRVSCPISEVNTQMQQFARKAKASTVGISWGLRSQTHYATPPPNIPNLQTASHFSVMKLLSRHYKQQLTSKCMVLVGIEVKVASCWRGGPQHSPPGHLCFRNVRNDAVDIFATWLGAAQVGRSGADGSGQPIGPIFSDQSIETFEDRTNRLSQNVDNHLLTYAALCRRAAKCEIPKTKLFPKSI